MVNELKMKKYGDKVFCETFKSLQLLNFTVLYYNFNMGTEELKKVNDLMHENNGIILDDVVTYDDALAKVDKELGYDVRHIVKEFPYRARVKMMGGMPKQKNMQYMNMANLESLSAVESLFMLVCYTMMKSFKWHKPQIELWWRNMKDNSMNYANGMKDEFIVQYFMDQIDLKLRG